MNVLVADDSSRSLMAAPVTPAFGAQQVPVSDAFSAIWRRKWFVLAVVLVISTPATAIIASLPRSYDAQAALVIDTGKTEFSDMQVRAGAMTGDTYIIRTQTDILMSREMAGRVVDRLSLAQRPEVRRLTDPKPGLPQIVLERLRGMLGIASAPTRPLTSDERRQVAISWLLGHVTAKNDGRSYTIMIDAHTNDPALCAAIANAYAASYLGFMRDLKVNALTRAHDWLDGQLSSLQHRVLAAEDAADSYRQAHGLIFSQGGTGDTLSGMTLTDRQMNEVASQLTTARGLLAEQDSEPTGGAGQGRNLDALPSIVASPLVQRLRGQLADLETSAAELRQTAMSDNPKLQNIEAAIAGLNGRIAAEQSKVAGSLREQADTTRTQVARLENTLRELQDRAATESAASVRLRQLLSEADAARTVYRDFLNRFEETSAQAAMQEPDAALVSAAVTPLGASGPHRGQLIGVSLLLSLIIGCAGALGLNRLRRGVRTAEQMETETGLFPLGFVPLTSDKNRLDLEHRTSVYTTSVDHVRNMLRFGDQRFNAKSVLVTSAVPGEGKTFFALSLAASASRDGGRALVVDADVRHASVGASIGHRFKAVETSDPMRPGFVKSRDIMPGVDLVTAGTTASRNGKGRLDTQNLETLLEEARSQYDLIVIDMPPVLAIGDATSVAHLADGVLMLVRWQRTPPAAVAAAVRRLQACSIRILGGVVTQVRTSELGASEGSHAHLFKSANRYYDA